MEFLICVIRLTLLRIAKGYITVAVLRQILHEIDDKISPSDLDLMIEEIDADGSGTVDFEGKSARCCHTSQIGVCDEMKYD